MIGTILAIPFYGHEKLIDGIVDFFSKNTNERVLFKKVLVIGDKPNGDNAYLQKKCDENGFHFIENKVNKGFVQSSNIAFLIARDERCNLMLLNSDVRPHPGCFAEMLDVMSLDDRISTVCPRTNNGSIANFYPWPVDIGDSITEQKFIGAFEEAREILPRVTFAPISVGFCILIKSVCLEEFGGFDAVYGLGYEEENDLCMRYSQYGYRSVIANHALAFHFHGLSFNERGGATSRDRLRRKNNLTLQKRYPYYQRRIHEYLNSASYKSICNLTGSKWDDTILIDIRGIGLSFNGTAEIAVRYIKQLIESGRYLDICSTREEYEFHGLSSLPNNKNFESPSRYYRTGIRIGQPFTDDALVAVPKFAYKSVLIFQDCIAYDCEYLASEKLETMWQAINSMYSHVVFISEYTKKIFELRFGAPLYSMVCLHSTDVNDYKILTFERQSPITKDYILVVGNDFKHKGIEHIIPIISRLNYKFLILGDLGDLKYENIEAIGSGQIPEDHLEIIYQQAKAVIYPSFYEGFGLPIMKALAYKKLIICRRDKPYDEIYSRLSESDKSRFIYYSRTSELENLKEWIEGWKLKTNLAEVSCQLTSDWAETVARFMKFVDENSLIKYEFLYRKYREIKYIDNNKFKFSATLQRVSILSVIRKIIKRIKIKQTYKKSV